MNPIFRGKIVTIPNLMSLARLLMVPWFIWVYLSKGDSLYAAGILVLSGLTDTLDGMIARRFNMVSNLGKALDPFADKVTQIAVVFCLIWRFPHMLYVFIALSIKELFALTTSLMAIYKTDEVLGADWHGKATTTLIYATMISHLVFPGMPAAVSDILIGLCIGMIVLSGVLYGIRNIRAVKAGRQNENSVSGMKAETVNTDVTGN